MESAQKTLKRGAPKGCIWGTQNMPTISPNGQGLPPQGQVIEGGEDEACAMENDQNALPKGVLERGDPGELNKPKNAEISPGLPLVGAVEW